MLANRFPTPIVKRVPSWRIFLNVLRRACPTSQCVLAQSQDIKSLAQVYVRVVIVVFGVH